MSTIDRSHWKSFANRFTKDYDGWSASVELRQADGGVEVAVDDRPFRGLIIEERGLRDSLILSFGDDPDEHLAHIIEDPIDLTLVDGGEDACSLVIGLEDGTGCILELTSPFTAD